MTTLYHLSTTQFRIKKSDIFKHKEFQTPYKEKSASSKKNCKERANLYEDLDEEE
jgi:hypothetical protein